MLNIQSHAPFLKRGILSYIYIQLYIYIYMYNLIYIVSLVSMCFYQAITKRLRCMSSPTKPARKPQLKHWSLSWLTQRMSRELYEGIWHGRCSVIHPAGLLSRSVNSWPPGPSISPRLLLALLAMNAVQAKGKGSLNVTPNLLPVDHPKISVEFVTLLYGNLTLYSVVLRYTLNVDFQKTS